ncbi:hypothetical protein C9439_00290 [archaeon SCG-AAA382B04]|nr:hypothetical protein C9439_00290 [archaeon SCG-AAA382B04]
MEARSQEVLDRIGKDTTLEQVKEFVEMAKDVGLDVLCSFMFPHPFDTKETIEEQKEFMKELSEMGAKETMSFTIPYPETYYYEYLDELGINFFADSWDEFDAKHLIIDTKNLTKQELEQELKDLVDEVGLETFKT